MPAASDPADHLAELFDAVTRGRQPDSGAALWFTAGVLHVMRHGGSLDAALGLSVPGLRSLRRRLLFIRRNAHLRAALIAVGLEPELIAWQRCKRLAPLVVSFMHTWPRLSSLSAPASDWADWKVHVWLAARCNVGMPTTADGLNKAVDGAVGYSVDEGWSNMLSRYL